MLCVVRALVERAGNPTHLGWRRVSRYVYKNRPRAVGARGVLGTPIREQHIAASARGALLRRCDIVVRCSWGAPDLVVELSDPARIAHVRWR